MNRRTKTIIAGTTGAILTLGAVGAAAAVVGSPEATPSVDNVATVAPRTDIAVESATTMTVYQTTLDVPAGWGLFRLNKDNNLRSQGADAEDLGDLATDVRRQLKKAPPASYMLIDMDTLDSGAAGVTSMLFTITRTGDFPVADSTLELRGWLDKVFRKVDATPAARFDKAVRRPSAWLEYTSGDNNEWLIREFIFQFSDRAVSVHFATDNEDPQAQVETAMEILDSLKKQR